MFVTSYDDVTPRTISYRRCPHGWYSACRSGIGSQLRSPVLAQVTVRQQVYQLLPIPLCEVTTELTKERLSSQVVHQT